jgi:hypothetical protein
MLVAMATLVKIRTRIKIQIDENLLAAKNGTLRTMGHPSDIDNRMEGRWEPSGGLTGPVIEPQGCGR